MKKALVKIVTSMLAIVILFAPSAFAMTESYSSRAAIQQTQTDEGIKPQSSEAEDAEKSNLKLTQISDDVKELINSSFTRDEEQKSIAVEIADNDSADPKSLTLQNEDDSKTVYMFNHPVKYTDKETGKMKFIDNVIVASKQKDAAKESCGW